MLPLNPPKQSHQTKRAAGGYETAGKKAKTSERELQPELNIAAIRCRRYRAELGRAKSCVRRPEVRVVEAVKRLCRKSQPQFFSEHEFLLKSEVPVIDPWASHRVSRRISKLIVRHADPAARGRREAGRIKGFRHN